MHQKLDYFESLGAFLRDLGYHKDFIIGVREGKEGIDWIRISAKWIDKEVTTHGSHKTPILRSAWRPDGQEVVENPNTTSKDGSIYAFLDARYENGIIRVTCNIMKGDHCEVREISVTQLRLELEMTRPGWIKLLIYNSVE